MSYTGTKWLQGIKDSLNTWSWIRIALLLFIFLYSLIPRTIFTQPFQLGSISSGLKPYFRSLTLSSVNALVLLWYYCEQFISLYHMYILLRTCTSPWTLCLPPWMPSVWGDDVWYVRAPREGCHTPAQSDPTPLSETGSVDSSHWNWITFFIFLSILICQQ